MVTRVNKILDNPRDIEIGVAVLNPSEEVYEELTRLLQTQAIIIVGGVPK
jgi:hypothetical protein